MAYREKGVGTGEMVFAHAVGYFSCLYDVPGAKVFGVPGKWYWCRGKGIWRTGNKTLSRHPEKDTIWYKNGKILGRWVIAVDVTRVA